MSRSLPLLLYPLLTHLALTAGSPDVAGLLLSAWGVGLLIVQGNGRPIFHRRRLLYLVMALAGVVVVSFPGANRLLLLPPVAISIALLAVFGASLRTQRLPLVTRIARHLRGYPDPILDRYTRRVTQVWVGFFTFLTAETILLALFAPTWLWAFFTGFLNYLLAVGLFVGEYLFRVRTYPHDHHGGLGSFLGSLARMDWRHHLRNPTANG